MSSYNSFRNQAQKDFIKKFDTLCSSKNRWEVWTDMIYLFAAAISNSVDKRFFDQREKEYMRVIGKYKREEQMVFPELLAMLVNIMEAAGYCDFLGELFMLLELGNDSGGQFFTPYDVCIAMAEMTMEKSVIAAEIERRGYISINDPACGAGATLIAAADVLKQMEINFQKAALFIAQDIDYTTALMCYVQLSLLGCAGYVRVGNTLTNPMAGSILHGGNNDEHTWFTPMWFSDYWIMKRSADAVKRMLPSVATSVPDDSDVCTDENMVSDESPVIDDKEPTEEAPVITISKKKKQPEGQLMFEF